MSKINSFYILLFVSIAGIMSFMPAGLVYAQGGGCNLTDFKSVVSCVINTMIDPLIALLVGTAVVVLLAGVVKYITKGDQPEERKKGGQLVLFGIIGLFVMVSVWGFVNILSGTFFPGGVDTEPPVPAISL